MFKICWLWLWKPSGCRKSRSQLLIFFVCFAFNALCDHWSITAVVYLHILYLFIDFFLCRFYCCLKCVCVCVVWIHEYTNLCFYSSYMTVIFQTSAGLLLFCKSITTLTLSVTVEGNWWGIKPHPFQQICGTHTAELYYKIFNWPFFCELWVMCVCVHVCVYVWCVLVVCVYVYVCVCVCVCVVSMLVKENTYFNVSNLSVWSDACIMIAMFTFKLVQTFVQCIFLSFAYYCDKC